MNRRAGRIQAASLLALGILAVGGLGATAILTPDKPRDARSCFLRQPPQTTLVIALDTSDPLIAVEPREVAFAVERAIGTLQSGDRVLAIDAAGKSPDEVSPVVDQCHPGDEDNTVRRAFQEKLLVPIERHLVEVRTRPASPESPLAETVVAVSSDPSLNREGTRLTILLVTDGLQNTQLESAYRPGSEFPRPPMGLLRGITVRLVLVRNARDATLQPRAVKRFYQWLTDAGAKVVYTPPGWLALQGNGRPGRHARVRG